MSEFVTKRLNLSECKEASVTEEHTLPSGPAEQQ
jgi:hypothetical protein